jgi:hypothetical protein
MVVQVCRLMNSQTENSVRPLNQRKSVHLDKLKTRTRGFAILVAKGEHTVSETNLPNFVGASCQGTR